MIRSWESNARRVFVYILLTGCARCFLTTARNPLLAADNTKQETDSIAKREGLGYFDEVDDHTWRLRKQVARQQGPKQSQSLRGPTGSFFQKNWEPDFACVAEMRVGPPGDGGKWVCDPYKLNATACLVYSIGSQNEFGFEMGIRALLPNCTVHTFDHTVEVPKPPEGVHFHSQGLSGHNGVPPLYDLLDLKAMHGHGGQTLDILKVDIEGAEYSSLLPLLDITNGCKLHARQVLIEIHPRHPIQFVQDLLQRFRNCGYAIFHKEPNIQFPVNHIRNEYAIEYSLIHLSLDFWGHGISSKASTLSRSCTKLFASSRSSSHVEGSCLHTSVQAVKVTNNNFSICVRQEPNLVDSVVRNTGGYWPDCQKIVKLLPSSPSEKWTVLDVGANIGACSIWVASLGHQVISFEPKQLHVELINASLALDEEIARKVTLHECGLGNRSSFGILVSEQANTGNSWVFLNKSEIQPIGAQSRELGNEPIKICSLNDFCETEINIMKIDTQGFERSVLEGAEKFLSKKLIKKIVFEFWPYGLRAHGSDPKELLDFLVGKGFQIWQDSKEIKHDQFASLVRRLGNTRFVDLLAVLRADKAALLPVDPQSTGPEGRCSWIRKLRSAERKVLSQGTQDGIISRIFSKIGIQHNFFVEFGFGYGKTITSENLNSFGLNTLHLRQNGWRGIYFDTNLHSEEFNVTQAILTPETIIQQFLASSVPVDVDYVSIDVDSVDLWLLHALIGEKSPYKPRLISVEFNINFAADMLVSMEKEWHAWTGRSIYGASAGAINYIGKLHGYTPIYIMPSGLDLFLLRDDILKEQCEQPPSFLELAARAQLPKRMHGLCSMVDVQRLVHVPSVLDGKMDLAYSLAKKEVHRLSKEFHQPICTKAVLKQIQRYITR
mmetsp:Transcript_5792/g.35963  ORF Transcript_5792/g.35963 Transcript_5792/m.35963 type:complete len:890 (+) Transcript_5792:259-2928(+)